MIGSLDLDYRPLYLCLTLYGNECHKCRSAPSFVNKKMRDESRFVELSTEEKQEIIDNAVLITTKKLQSLRLDY